MPPPTVQPYPKLGLASTSPLAFKRIEPIDQSDPMWMKVVDAVGAAISKAEDEMDGRPIMNSVPQPKHPTPAAERAKVATRVESLYRVPYGAGQSLYYVEATKRYGMPPLPADRKAPAPSPKDGCSVMTFANGFFVAGADGAIPPPTLNVRVTSCDYDTVSLMLPLAAIGEGKAQVWIGQVTGWDYEAYAGFRWNEQDARSPTCSSRTAAGACRPTAGSARASQRAVSAGASTLRTSTTSPAIAAAATIAGLMSSVRPVGLPCRPLKLRLDDEAHISAPCSLSGFMPRHIEQPAPRHSKPASRKI